jgi:tetratricopeptide (TPR) repeat protein
LGNILHYCGRSSEAIPKIKDAMRISPIYPTWYLTLLAAAYRESGDLDRSIAEAGRAVELSPNDRDALLVLCSDYGLAGQWERARQLAEGVVRIDPAFSIAKYAEGQPYRNKETLDRLTESYKRAGLPA